MSSLSIACAGVTRLLITQALSNAVTFLNVEDDSAEILVHSVILMA